LTSTAATSSGLGSVGGRGLGTSVALAGALDGLVHNLGGRLGLSVGVELQVVACVQEWLEGILGDGCAICDTQKLVKVLHSGIGSAVVGWRCEKACRELLSSYN